MIPLARQVAVLRRAAAWRSTSLSLSAGLLAVFGLGVAPSLAAPPPSPCPKVLMFDGFQLQAHNDEAWARYWGETVGVEGFLLNQVMPDWSFSVGRDAESDLHQSLKQFQELYARHGVTENFIKVALYRQLDWHDAAAADRVVENFRQAARLARSAELRGLALDLEPYVEDFWAEDQALPDKPQRAFQLGRRIGQAIQLEFPEASVLVFPEVLVLVLPPYSPRMRSAYRVAPDFWDGLVRAPFKQLLVGIEKSYQASRPDLVAREMRELYRIDLLAKGLDPAAVPLVVGLWPLGKTYTDKRARETPARFEQRLRLAFDEPSPYVWIYGHGSAWQEDGPYGQGKVDPNFADYVHALQEVKASCRAARSSP